MKSKMKVLLVFLLTLLQSQVWATCPAGMYLAPGFFSVNDCRNCWDGTYSNAGASTCYNCPKGKASVRGDGYSALIAAPCTNCATGTFTSSEGATSCSQCGAGKASSEGSSSCTQCGAGTASSAGAGSCTQCGAGTASSAGAGSCTQ